MTMHTFDSLIHTPIHESMNQTPLTESSYELKSESTGLKALAFRVLAAKRLNQAVNQNVNQAQIEVNQNQERVNQEITPDSSSKTLSQLVRNYKAARPWLLEWLDQLHAAGWTRAALFRRGRLAYPFGPWGVAWSMWWTVPRVIPQITPEGLIQFAVREPAGRVSILTARPGRGGAPPPGPGA